MSIRRRLHKLLAVNQEIRIDRSWIPKADLLLTVAINPSRGEITKLLQANQQSGLRVIDNGKDFVVWPAEAAIHHQVADALPEFRAVQFGWSIDINTRNKNAQFKVGRFNVDVWRGEGDGKVSPHKMSDKMQRSLGPLLTRIY